MMIIHRVLKTLWDVAGRRKMTCAYYVYCPQRQGEGHEDKEICCYDATCPPPAAIVRQMKRAHGRMGFFLMPWRMKRGLARLLCLVHEGRLCAYGWIQQWGPFGRRLGWLTPDAVMLGPYWTAPSERGKGLYGRLLAHSIAACAERHDKPVLILAHPGNRASLRGIEKAGFLRLGVYEVTSWLCRTVNRHRTIEQDRSLAEALALGDGLKET